jgi:hypothetical protein
VSEAPSIVFAGSSSVEPSSPLPAALAAELALRPSQWVARGIRGSRLAQWTQPALPPGLRAIVVLLTANDPHPTAAEVCQVDAALRAFAPIVVWLPPLPYPERSRAAGRDAVMRAALAGAGVVWVDRPIRIEPARWAPDRVHLTAAGTRDYARQVGAELAVRLSIALDRIGHARTERGHRPPLSSVDAVWLARAIVGEGGIEADALAIASTMVRRWALLRDADASSPFRTLTDLIVGRFAGADPYDGDGREVVLRGYSQPVAVQWRQPSDAAADARRRRIRELPWDAIEPWRRSAVLQVLTGRVPLAARPAVHFAAPDIVAAGLARHDDWRRVIVEGAQNAFVSTAAARRAAEPAVVGADRVSRALSSDAARWSPVLLTSCVALAVGLGVAIVVR